MKKILAPLVLLTMLINANDVEIDGCILIHSYKAFAEPAVNRYNLKQTTNLYTVKKEKSNDYYLQIHFGKSYIKLKYHDKKIIDEIENAFIDCNN